MVPPIIVPPVVLQALPKLQHFLSTPGGILLAVIGLALIAVSLLRTVLGVASFVWTYFLRPAPNLRRYGTWAVVTGATDGIGKAYCVALAKKGATLDRHDVTQTDPFGHSACQLGSIGVPCLCVVALQHWCPAQVLARVHLALANCLPRACLPTKCAFRHQPGASVAHRVQAGSMRGGAARQVPHQDQALRRRPVQG